MSGDGLAGTLDLLRRVLALEQRQGYRNTAATGGLYRYFQDHFGKHEYDAATWAAVEGLLRGLKRYEAMHTVDERYTQTEILLRRIGELEVAGPGQAQQADRTDPRRLARGLRKAGSYLYNGRGRNNNLNGVLGSDLGFRTTGLVSGPAWIRCESCPHGPRRSSGR